MLNLLLGALCLFPTGLPQAGDMPSVMAEEKALSLLQAWAEDSIPAAQQAEVYAKLRGNLYEEGARRLVAMLETPTIPLHNELLELLLQIPYAVSRPILFDFALRKQHAAAERGRVAEFLLLLDGHDAIEALGPSLTADAAPPYVRRVFAGWRECVQAEDLPLLEELARTLKEYPAQYALQLWARHETRPEVRQQIYLLARQASPSFRAAALEALASQGKDETIAALLRTELDNSGAEMRRLARRMLPLFSSYQDLLEQYKQRAPNLSLNLRGRWMVDLASSPLPEAQRLVMEWLVDGGWDTGIKAQQVVMLLGRSSEVDPLLPVLLHHEAIPERVLFPLALARSPFNDDARAYLLQLLPHAESVPQMKIVRALAQHGEEEDLLLLRDVAESNIYSTAARSLARELLVGLPPAEALIEKWLQADLPQDYEIAASWLRALAASDHPAWVDAAVALAQSAPGFAEEDLRRGLRMEVWSALAVSSKKNRGILEQELLRKLKELQTEPRDESSWGSMTRLSRAYPELGTLLHALQVCTMEMAPVTLDMSGLDIESIPADILFSCASTLAYTHSTNAAEWLEHLLRRSLQMPERLQVLGVMANRLPPGPARRHALAILLEQPEFLEEWHLAVAEAFAPEGASWVLLADRIQERALVDAVEAGEEELSSLHSLLSGYAEDSVLRRAVELATKGNQMELALQLAQRRVDHMPLSDVAHAQLAQLLTQVGQLKLAKHQWEIVRRLAPNFSELWQQAQTSLEQQSQ